MKPPPRERTMRLFLAAGPGIPEKSRRAVTRQREEGRKLNSVMVFSRTGGITFLFFLSASVSLIFLNAAPAGTAPASTTSTIVRSSVDGETSMAHVRAMCAMGPRVPGTMAIERCRVYIEGILTPLGYEVTRQPFRGASGEGAGVEFCNLRALKRRVPGGRRMFKYNPGEVVVTPDKSSKFILCAHYDSRPFCEHDPVDPSSPLPGANDGASGTAVLLTLAQALAGHEFISDLEFVFFDGEDYGHGMENMLYGSKHFVAILTPAEVASIETVILLDMIGDADLTIRREPSSFESDPGSVDRIIFLGRSMGFNQFTFQGQWPRIFDDHSPFHARGIKALVLIDFDYPHWHTTADTPDKVSAESLKAVEWTVFEFVAERLLLTPVPEASGSWKTDPVSLP